MREEVVTRCDIVYYSVRWNNLCFHTVSFRLNTKFIWLLECFYSLCLFSTKTYCTEHTDVYYNWLRMYTLTVCVCVCVSLLFPPDSLTLPLISAHYWSGVTELQCKCEVFTQFKMFSTCFEFIHFVFSLSTHWNLFKTKNMLIIKIIWILKYD